MPLLFVLAVASFVSAFSIQLINPLVPAIARDFAIAPAEAAMLATAFTGTYALSQLALGPIGDAYGKARVIQVCLAVLALSTVFCALATRFEHLFAARMLGGVAGGGIIPVGFAIVGDRFPMESRQVALSRMLMASQMAIILGSATSGMIAEAVGWRQAFIAPGLACLAAVVLTLLYLKPRPGIVRAPMSLARTKSGYREAMSGPFAAVCLGGVFFGGMAMFGILPFMANRLEARGLGGLREAGFAIACLSLGGLAFTLVVKRLLDALGRPGLVRAGAMTVATGFVGLAFSPHWLAEGAAFAVAGFGYFMVHNSLQTLGTELAPNARGSGMALFACILFLGQAIGPIVYRGLFAAFGNTIPLLIGAAALLTVGLTVAANLRRLERARSA